MQEVVAQVPLPPAPEAAAVRARVVELERERTASLEVDPDAVVHVGALVRVEGLVARRDLNGFEGVVRSFDEASGRFGVRVRTEARATTHLTAVMRTHTSQLSCVHTPHA